MADKKLSDDNSDTNTENFFNDHLARCRDVENGWSDIVFKAIIDGRIPVDKTSFTSRGTKAIFPGKRVTPYMSTAEHKKKCRVDFSKVFGDSICIVMLMEPDKRKNLALTMRRLIIHNWFKIWPLPEEADDTEKLRLICAEVETIGAELQNMLIHRRIEVSLARAKKQPAPYKVYTCFDNWRTILINNLNASRCHKWPTYTPPPGPPGPPEVLDMKSPWDRSTFVIRLLGKIPRAVPPAKV